MFAKSIKQSAALAAIVAVLAGCSSTSTVDESAPAADTAPAVETGTTTEAPVVVEKDPLEGVDTVFYFDFDQSLLKSEARVALTAHAAVLRESPRSIRLEGHADERGTREYNMALGERRANAVRDFLVLQGVDSSLIETVSYGEEYPASNGTSEAAYSQNRRVELK